MCAVFIVFVLALASTAAGMVQPAAASGDTVQLCRTEQGVAWRIHTHAADGAISAQRLAKVGADEIEANADAALDAEQRGALLRKSPSSVPTAPAAWKPRCAGAGCRAAFMPPPPGMPTGGHRRRHPARDASGRVRFRCARTSARPRRACAASGD